MASGTIKKPLDSAVNALQTKAGKINFAIRETGTFSIAAQTATTQSTTPITYAQTYASAPYVIVVGTNQSACVYGMATVSSTSKTGATIVLRNNANHSGAATFRWYTLEAV